MTESGLTYRDAGVDIDAGDELVERIKPVVKKTMRKEVLAGIGGFGALVEVPLDRYRRPVLVSGTDGVGTKLRLAIDTGRHDKIGIDLVAMCANDIAVSGAEPLFFLDYYATGKLRVDVAESVIRGIAEGCELAGAALVGGETAEMPGMYHGDDYDLAGFCVGVVERDRIIDGTKIAAGDVVIGLASSGPHSNGYSLIRKLVSVAGADEKTQLDGKSLFDRLLTPTRIYVKSMLALAQKINVKGFAHITGGGLTDNIPRVLPDGFEVALHRRSWARDPVFDWLAATGKIAATEMYRTFNCGIGMIVVVAPSDVDAALAQLAVHGRNRDDHWRRRSRHARRGDRRVSELPVAVVISGRGSNMEAIARASLSGASRYRVVRVIADRDSAGGLARAATLGIPTSVVPVKQFADRASFDAALAAELDASGARLVALAGFMRILSAEFVQRFEGRLLNIHPSLLPKYKGLDTHARAIAAGDTQHGASVHYVTAELDGGPVIMQGRLRLRPTDTPEAVSARVHTLEHIIYPHVCSLIAAGRIECRNGTVFFDGAPLAAPLIEENDAAA